MAARRLVSGRVAAFSWSQHSDNCRCDNLSHLYLGYGLAVSVLFSTICQNVLASRRTSALLSAPAPEDLGLLSKNLLPDELTAPSRRVVK